MTTKTIAKPTIQAIKPRKKYAVVKKVQTQNKTQGGLYVAGSGHDVLVFEVVSVGNDDELKGISSGDVILVDYTANLYGVEHGYLVHKDDILGTVKASE